jgi:hypothetical protein
MELNMKTEKRRWGYIHPYICRTEASLGDLKEEIDPRTQGTQAKIATTCHELKPSWQKS